MNWYHQSRRHYRGLMTTIAEIFFFHSSIRIYSTRAAFRLTVLPGDFSARGAQSAVWQPDTALFRSDAAYR